LTKKLRQTINKKKLIEQLRETQQVKETTTQKQKNLPTTSQLEELNSTAKNGMNASMTKTGQLTSQMKSSTTSIMIAILKLKQRKKKSDYASLVINKVILPIKYILNLKKIYKLLLI